jgi:D-3-phosphoglycerate dehydrogenase
VGVDNIDVHAATKRGIVVMNAPGGNTVTTAEHAISLMLSLARNIPQATASIRAGKWEKKALTGVEISGKTLGIIGLGQIGRVVAEKAKGLNMKVVATDPFVSPEAAKTLEVELLPLDQLLGLSDFISLHVPRLKETTGMINESALKKMKKGTRLINCSRGDIVVLDDLQQAVENGHVAGAALDVYPQEPPEFSLPIFQNPHIIFTPHLGAGTQEAQINVAEMIAKQISAYLLNDVIINAVNFPSLSRKVMDRLRPYLDLTEKMGAMMGQLIREIHDVTVTYSGVVADLDTRPLTNALLKGLLDAYSDKPVNYVSAPVLASEKGIKVNENITQEKDDYRGLIRVTLEGREKDLDEIWGTIFARKYPRIVRLGKIHMDAIPEGSMIVIQNYDKPGVIGNVGSVLGKHGINIARFQLGRRDDRALCLVNIDATAPDKVIEEIRSLPHILFVSQVHLKS